MNPDTITKADKRFMAEALALAETALDHGEFPVGCVIADRETVIARGHRTGTVAGAGNEIDHAEINALRQLCETETNPAEMNPDRSALTLYSTMEPCLMCFSAILLSNVKRIVYAYEDVMGGGTGLDRSGLPPLYRDAQLTVIPGVLRKESLLLFRRFFAESGNAYWADSPLSRHSLSQRI